MSMKINSATSADAYAGSSGEDAQLRLIQTQLRSLGDGAGARFSVVRDPATQRFVVQVVDPVSKTVVDQFPAEEMIKRRAARDAALKSGAGANDPDAIRG
jgi:hypothetical protein